MKALNYERLFLNNPTKLWECFNQKYQLVEFYENPILGDYSAIIAVFHKYKTAVETDFFDLEDFYFDSDYLPVYTQSGKVVNYFEL